MYEVENDMFDILDCNYEGYIYDDEAIFHFMMDDIPFPTIDNFYNRLIQHSQF